MVRTIADAEIRGYHAGNQTTDDPDYILPSEILTQPIDYGRRLNALVDEGSVAFLNDSGILTGGTGNYGEDYGDVFGGTVNLRDGDRVELWTRRARETLDAQDDDVDLVGNYAEDYGDSYGGTDTKVKRRWTAMLRHPKFSLSARGQSVAEFDLDDFVFGLLKFREVRNTFEEERIAVAPDESEDGSGILDTILANEVPEIDLSGIETLDQETDAYWDGRPLLDCVDQLITRSKAWAASDDRTFVFRPLEDLSPKFALTGADYRTIDNDEDTDDLVTEMRIDGGDQSSIDVEQTTQDGTTLVDQDDRIIHQVSPRKSEFDRIEVWTNRTGADANMIVRLQSDDGGAPVAIDDTESDIARRELAPEFISEGDYTTFLLEEHTFSPNNDPWIIIETDDPDGAHEVGVNTATGEPAFKAHFSYPLATVVEDATAAETYRHREGSDRDASLKSRRATIDAARTAIERRTQPASTISFEAESERAHDLMPSDLIEVDEPTIRATGEYVVTEVRDHYDPNRNELRTEITARDIATL